MAFHIVGIDPSLSGTGVCRIRPEDAEPITFDLIDSKPIPNAGYIDTLVRMRNIAGRVIRAARVGMEEGDVLVVIMEGPIFGQSTGQYHTRAGLWWILYHLLEKLGAFVIIEPTRLKRYVTGKGNAPKDVVFSTVVRNFPHLGIMDNNIADAIGLACMGARELGYPMEPSVQRVTPAALEGVAWPWFMADHRRAL